MQHLITQYTYLAVFLLMLAESACIPVPSEVIMLFGGALASGAVAGAHPSLAGIIAAGVLGNVAGSYVAWAVGRYAGQAAARRWGRRVGIREREVDRAVAWFDRHGPAAVLVGRLIPVVRTFISLPAGFAAMPAVKFGVYTTLGCIPWTAALGIAGYALGANWESVANGFHGPTYAIAGVVVVAIAVALVMRVRHARKASGAGDREANGSGPGEASGSGAGEASGSGTREANDVGGREASGARDGEANGVGGREASGARDGEASGASPDALGRRPGAAPPPGRHRGAPAGHGRPSRDGCSS